jgi:hypothetical protein
MHVIWNIQNCTQTSNAKPEGKKDIEMSRNRKEDKNMTR